MLPLLFASALPWLVQVPDPAELIPPGIAEKSPAFWAGAIAVLWIVERVFGYALQFRKELTPESLAQAVKQQLTADEVHAMREEMIRVLAEDPKTDRMARQIGILYEWHDREDPDRPGWKIWWTSSKDYRRLVEVAERQSQLDRELLGALDRRAELDRMMMNTLETVTRAAANASAEAAAARNAAGECLAEIKSRRTG